MSVNQVVADDFIAHAVDLERFTSSEQKKVRKILKTLERDLTYEIQATEFDEVKRTAFKIARMEKMLIQTTATIGTSYRHVKKEQKAAMRELAIAEEQISRQIVNKAVGVDIMSVAVSPEQLRRVADDTLISGAPSKTWWSRQSVNLKSRFTDSMRQGVLMGDTTQDLVQRVRGTRALGFKNGLINAPRHQAEALVRTSVQTVANRAREDSFAANSDVIKGVQQLSTLDTKTTNVCKAYDRKVWSQTVAPNGSVIYKPTGHGLPWVNVDRQGGRHAGPPRHWNCRSVTNPVVKSWEELGAQNIKQENGRSVKGADAFFRKALKARGKTDAQISQAIRNGRASMTGTVSQKTGYEQWLRRQVDEGNTSRAIDALGKTRFKLWDSGKIGIQDLVDQKGRELTIPEILKKHNLN